MRPSRFRIYFKCPIICFFGLFKTSKTEKRIAQIQMEFIVIRVDLQRATGPLFGFRMAPQGKQACDPDFPARDEIRPSIILERQARMQKKTIVDAWLTPYASVFVMKPDSPYGSCG